MTLGVPSKPPEQQRTKPKDPIQKPKGGKKS